MGKRSSEGIAERRRKHTADAADVRADGCAARPCALMRLLFLSVFAALAILLPAPCHAERVMPTVDGTLNQQHVGLGSLRPGITPEEVQQIWGPPETVDQAGYGNVVYSYLGGSFVVTFQHGWLRMIACSAREGLSPDSLPMTPNGVAPGQDANVLNENYGKATQTEEIPDGHTVYAYWGNNTATYQYLFFYTKDGIIDRIVCGMGD